MRLGNICIHRRIKCQPLKANEKFSEISETEKLHRSVCLHGGATMAGAAFAHEMNMTGPRLSIGLSRQVPRFVYQHPSGSLTSCQPPNSMN